MAAKKLKVFGVRSELSLDEIVSLFLRYSFDTDEGKGVEVLVEDSGLVKAKYHEQRQVSESFVDVYGEVVVNTYTRYHSFLFDVFLFSEGVYFFVIEFPPRSVKSFFDFLKSFLGRGFSVSELKCDLYGLYKTIGEHDGVTLLRASRLQASNLTVDPVTVMRVAFESTEDAMSRFLTMVPGQQDLLEKIRVEFRYQHENSYLEITKGASILHDMDYGFLVHLIGKTCR